MFLKELAMLKYSFGLMKEKGVSLVTPPGRASPLILDQIKN
jgi:hypothetical protein